MDCICVCAEDTVAILKKSVCTCMVASMPNFARSCVIIRALLIFVGKGDHIPPDCHACTYIELCSRFFQHSHAQTKIRKRVNVCKY